MYFQEDGSTQSGGLLQYPAGMKSYSIILFDLDGTLTDPTHEILGAARYALHNFGIEQVDEARLREFLQRPLLQVFEQDFGMSLDQANQAFHHYWYYAGSFGVKMNLPYPGIEQMLAQIKQEGKEMAIATARPTKNAVQILKSRKMGQYFSHVYGACDENQRRTKKVIIFDALCEYPDHEEDEEHVIMVGDRTMDILGARDNGIDSLAVTYGQDPADQLRQAEPTYIADTIDEMTEILLR